MIDYEAVFRQAFRFKTEPHCACYEAKAVRRAYMAVNPRTGRTYATPIEASALSNCVARWRATHTPAYMDEALVYCYEHHLPILPELLKNLADAGRTRMGNRTTKGIREGVKDAAFRMIANLIFAGDTLTDAAGRTAVWSQETPHPFKASSLEKEYPKVWRSGQPSLEEELLQFWKEHPDPELSKVWANLRVSIPLPDQEIKGERR